MDVKTRISCLFLKYDINKGPYQNYVIKCQDDIDDNPHRGGRWFKILGNRDDVILI